MYFDPLSAWLVALIADGLVIAGEKCGSGSAQADWDRERIIQGNKWLNNDIRNIKSKYGLDSSIMAYEKIQMRIRTTKNSIAFKYANGEIAIDPDNQEYIITLLETCAKHYSRYTFEEAKRKAEWYSNAAIEARRRKEQFVAKIEENRIKEEKETLHSLLHYL